MISLLSLSSFAENYLLHKVENQNQKKNLGAQLKFKLSQINYLSESEYDHQDQQNAEAELSYQTTEIFFNNAIVNLGSFSEKKSSYAFIPELYSGYGKDGESYIAVGRKRKNFSNIDTYYNVGLYSPQFTNDFIQYTEQGLTGLHMQYFSGEVGYYLSFNPLFFPNQKPQVHEDNGNLISSNRWAQRPPSAYQFVDKNHKIEYAIRDYSIREIIENQGGAASFFFGKTITRPAMQFSYANLPLNDIPLSRDTYGSAIDSVGHIILSPVVTYHEVRSVDLNYDFANFQTSWSYAEDQVFNKIAADNETLQNLQPIRIYGVIMSTDLKENFHRELKISLALAEVRGGEIKDINQEGKESLFAFAAQRSLLKSPVTLGLTVDLLYIGSKPLKTFVRWTYDQAYKGGLLSSQLSYETFSKVNFQLGFDFIGVEDENEVQARNFFASNKANDRLYAGLQYGF